MRRTPLVLLAVAVICSLPPAARAQRAAPGMVRLASISPWVAPDRPLEVTLQITNPAEVALENVRVRVQLFNRVVSRSHLRVALDRGEASRVGTSFVEPLEEPIPPGEQRTVTITRAHQDLPSLRRNGVYPVEITVEHSEGRVSLATAIVHHLSPPETRLNLVWIVPVTRPLIAASAEGVYDERSIRALNLDELGQQIGVLARRASLPITIAISPMLVDTLTDLSDGFAVRRDGTVHVVADDDRDPTDARAILEDLRTIATGAAEIASVPYAPVDLPALVAHGADDLRRQFDTGRTVLGATLGREPDGGVIVPTVARLDTASARAATTFGATGVVVDPSLITGQLEEPFRPDQFGPSRPIALRAGDRTVTALAPDLPLAERLAGDEQGILLTQGIVAETGSSWFELPLLADERVLTIWSSTTPGPTALSNALDALAAAPWVRLRTASDAISSLPPRNDPVSFGVRTVQRRAYLTEAAAARRALESLTTILLDPLPEIDSLNRVILLAESSVWDAAPERGRALARTASARIARIFRGVRVASRTVTFTSRRGRLPVTVVNENDFPVRVRLRLDSPKLVFDDGSVRTIELPARDQTFDFAVEARAAGSFPVAVRIETPDGRRTLGTSELVVRSTAVSAVSLAVVAGSATLLVVSSIRRTRRRNGHGRKGTSSAA